MYAQKTEICCSLLLRIFHGHCTHCERVKAVLPSPLVSTFFLISTQDTSPISPSVPAVIFHHQDGAKGEYNRVQWLDKNSSFGTFWQMLSAGPPICTELKWYQNVKFGFGHTNAIIMKISRRNTVCLLSHLTFPCICYLRAFAQAHSRFLCISFNSFRVHISDCD